MRHLLVFAIGSITFFGYLIVQKSWIEPAAVKTGHWLWRKHIDPMLAKYLPELYRRLDPLMPDMLTSLNGTQIRVKVYEELMAIAKDSLDKDQIREIIDEFGRQFDPFVCADQVNR